MYQVLARKYRPKNFHQLLGQDHVAKALINAINHQRLHHAYLFTGTRGVGKTTIARILAKCLNCETGITSEPCGNCNTCQAIDSGRFIDLIEIDAASRTKVEDTRELLDNVPYAPTQGRYKVYLIDEVHMLSTHSFNALLKTLEEPPEHVKFLLATTDPQKLPITIISRCLQFVLRPLSQTQLAEYLGTILQQENINYQPEALWQLATSAKGSVRDALSLTDQAIAFGNEHIQQQTVEQMLGLIDQADTVYLLGLIAQQRSTELAKTMQQLRQKVVDAKMVFDGLAETLHQLAILQLLPNFDLQIQPHQQQQLQQLSQQLPAELVQLYYEIVVQSREKINLANTPMQALEMCLLRLLAFKPLHRQQMVVNPPQHQINIEQPKIENIHPIENVDNYQEIENVQRIENVDDYQEIANIQPIENVDNYQEIANIQPIENIDDSQEIANIQPIENVDDYQEIENVQRIESVGDYQEIANIQPIENIDDSQEIANIQPIENVDDYQEIANIQPIETIGDYQEIKNVQPIENVDNYQEIANIQLIENVDNYQEIENIQLIESGDDYQEIENIQPIETIGDYQEIENVQPMENVDNYQEIENIQLIENVGDYQEIANIQPIENVDNSQEIANIQHIENVDNSQEIANIQPIENVDNYQEIENVQPIQSTIMTPVTLLEPSYQAFVGQWTVEKWDYFIYQARKNHWLDEDELALARQGLMVGEIDGDSEFVTMNNFLVTRQTFQEFTKKLQKQFSGIKVIVREIDEKNAKTLQTPEFCREKRQQQAEHLAKELLSASPVVQALLAQQATLGAVRLK